MKHKQIVACLLLLLNLARSIFATEQQASEHPQTLEEIVGAVDNRQIIKETDPIQATRYSRTPLMMVTAVALASTAAYLMTDEQVCHPEDRDWHERRDSISETISWLGSSFSSIGHNYFLSSLFASGIMNITTNVWTPFKNYLCRTLQSRAAVTVEEQKQITRIKNLLAKLEKYNQKPDGTPYKNYFKIGLDLLNDKISTIQDEGTVNESLLYKRLFKESNDLIHVLEVAYAITCAKVSEISKETLKTRLKHVQTLANYNDTQYTDLARLCAKAYRLTKDCNNSSQKKSSGALYLEGLPGTGKTTFVKAFAWITGLPLVEIKCTQLDVWKQNQKDTTENTLRTAGKLDALSTNFATAASETGKAHPIKIIFLDEVDKLLSSHNQEARALISQWADPTASQTIWLSSLGIDVPLSNCILILAGNIPLDKLVQHCGLGELQSRLHTVTFERSTDNQRELAIQNALNERETDESRREKMCKEIMAQLNSGPQLAGTRAIKGVVERFCDDMLAKDLGLSEPRRPAEAEDVERSELDEDDTAREGSKEQSPHSTTQTDPTRQNEDVLPPQLALYGQIATIFAQKLGPEIAKAQVRLLQASKDQDETPESP